MQGEDTVMEDADTVAEDNEPAMDGDDVIMEDVELTLEGADSNIIANEFERFGEDQASQNGGVCRIPLLPSFEFQGFCPEECHFRMAESQFLRMTKNRNKKVSSEIKSNSIGYCSSSMIMSPEP